MHYINPAHKQEVHQIKCKLKEIGWTLIPADHELKDMNHGPLHTRDQAEVLYKQWNRLVNPYNF